MSHIKTLLLMRHGEAGWGDVGQADVKRSLTERGIKQVHSIAKHMLGEGVLPDMILSSTAKRAEMTSKALATKIDYDMKAIQWHDDLYLAEASALFNAARQADDAIQTLAIVAHNPGLSELADHLLPSQPIGGMSPADVVAITWSVSHWQDISAETGRLQAHLHPNI